MFVLYAAAGLSVLLVFQIIGDAIALLAGLWRPPHAEDVALLLKH